MIQSKFHLATVRFDAMAPVALVAGRRSCLLMPALLALWLSACAPMAVRPTGPIDSELALAAQAQREAALAEQPDWSFSGRVALSQGKEGGSGRIDWVQRGAEFDIRLAAPITRQSWRLHGQGGQVRLEGLDGGVREGSDAEALLLAATGWRIPVDAMARWVRGARAPGAATLEFDPSLRPAMLHQQGWDVDYRQFDSAEPALPTKVFARQGEASVRLVIDRWSAP